MRKTIITVMAAASIFALAACTKQSGGNEASGNAALSAGASVFDGTWKADLASVQIESKPDVYLLKDGQFSCSTCVPPLVVAADGAFHAVTGRPYADEISVKVADDHNVTRTNKKGGRETGVNKMNVSADGKTLTVDFIDSSTPDAKPVTGSYTETRVAEAPAGAHAVSGSWKPDKYNSVSDEGIVTTYKLDGDMLHMTTPGGVSYDAKLGGAAVPVKGDIGGTTVAVARAGDNGFTETYTRGGKVTSIGTFTVTDGKMNVVFESKQDGSTTRYVANTS
jgi:hypothetical protein